MSSGRAAPVSDVGKVPAGGTGRSGGRRLTPWPHWPDCAGCEGDVRECRWCHAFFSLPACITRPDGVAKYGSDTCLPCATPPRVVVARSRHGDHCNCVFCVRADREENQ
jgi:hypothetical protein